MMSLLSLFTGNWKKNGIGVPAPAAPVAFVPAALPSLTLRNLPLRSGNGCLPTMSDSWRAGWRTGCACTAPAAGWERRGSCWRR